MTRLLFIYLFSIAAASVASAQTNYSLRASLVNPYINAGEVGMLELKATGDEPDQMPRSINAPGLSVSYSGSNPVLNDTRMVNNRIVMFKQYDYFYKVQGRVPGAYTIPSITVTINGKKVKSAPVTVHILKANGSNIVPTSPYFARLTGPEKAVYEKQIFPIEANIYVEGRNSIYEVIIKKFTQESFVIKPFPSYDRDAIDLRGQVYSIAKLPTTMYALKQGDYRIGPASFDVKIYERDSRFSSQKISSLTEKPKRINSDTFRINVLPLPGGAPDSFSGGVGAFEMEDEVSPKTARVGDPVTVKLTVRGAGNLQTMDPPMIKSLDPEVWKTYKPKKELIKGSDGVEAGEAVFTQVLIPLKEVSEVPAFELCYFDPQHKQYLVRRTVPTSIIVESSEVLSGNTPETVSLPSRSVESFPAVAPPTAQFPDIMHIRRSIPKWRAYSPTGSKNTWFVLTNGLLAIVFCGVLGIGVLRRVREHQAKLDAQPKTQTFKDAMHHVRPGVEREAFFHAALDAFSLWNQENPNAGEEVRTLVAELKGKCENALYSQNGADDGQPITTAEASEYIKVLKRLAR